MIHLKRLLVASLSILSVVAGCDRKPAKTASADSPSPTAASSPAAAAANKEPDSHPKVANDLLAAAKDLSATLAGINSDADAKAAEPKLRELGERHEALAARSQALPPRTKETDQAIRTTVQTPLQTEARVVADHMERLKPVASITDFVMPYIARIGQAAQVVAQTSHVRGRPIDVDDGSKASDDYNAAWHERYKPVTAPPMIRSGRVGRYYVANAAPIVQQFGASRVAVLRFGQASTTDHAFVPLMSAAARSLKLTPSLPTVLSTGRTTTDVYLTVGPVDDLNTLATAMKGLIPDSRTSVNENREVYVGTESSTAAQNKRAAKLAELGQP